MGTETQQCEVSERARQAADVCLTCYYGGPDREDALQFGAGVIQAATDEATAAKGEIIEVLERETEIANKEIDNLAAKLAAARECLQWALARLDHAYTDHPMHRKAIDALAQIGGEDE